MFKVVEPDEGRENRLDIDQNRNLKSRLDE